MKQPSTLPDFADPPVIETVLGVEFAPLNDLDVLKIGLFWDTIRQDYPSYKIMPALGSRALAGAASETSSPPQIEFLAHLPIRCWFMDASQVRLIQVQNDRFIHNWRKVGSTETYPHYETIRPIFEREWSRFIEFLAGQGVPPPQIRECEISYVNHVEKGKG